ncbi:hypothetical protein BY458DRAFT_486498 [Sporodiniella umbellata]|nr:hypothetical protein BY458DRAFT_486498 [Sporodiniella umbellata]
MELPQVGKYCQLQNCSSLDFLPVTCPSCQKTFCGDHRLPINHNCLQQNQIDVLKCEKCSKLIKSPPGLSSETTLREHIQSNCVLHRVQEIGAFNRECALKGCCDVDVRVGPVLCEGCNRKYCLRHRHPSSHECTSLLANEKRKLERKAAAQEQVAKVFKLPNQPAKDKTIAPSTKTNTGNMVELMKLKSKAKGDPSVSVTSRIYLYTEFPSSSKMERVCVYFDKSKSVGRALDILANMSKMTNKNNVLSSSDPERLCLYKYPEMTILDNSLPLEANLKNMDLILLEKQSFISL